MLNSPSLVPIATCPTLLTATALHCWFGGSKDKDEPPKILLIFPGFELTIPTC